jgi:integral membrane sensor domain MASE1
MKMHARHLMAIASWATAAAVALCLFGRRTLIFAGIVIVIVALGRLLSSRSRAGQTRQSVLHDLLITTLLLACIVFALLGGALVCLLIQMSHLDDPPAERSGEAWICGVIMLCAAAFGTSVGLAVRSRYLDDYARFRRTQDTPSD